MRVYGIDLGGTAIKIGLVENEQVVNETEIPTDVERGAEAIMDHIAVACQQLGSAERAGIGTPGTVNGITGEVVYCNNLRWSHVQLARELSRRLGVPVRAANDASMAALAEQALGATKGYDCAAVVTLGTGLGCGVTRHGELWISPVGAPEFGHTSVNAPVRYCTCGRPSCLEAYCSVTGLVLTANRRGLVVTNGKEVLDAYFSNNALAVQIMEEWLDLLAQGMGNLANSFRPEVIAFSGGITKAGDWFLEPLANKMRQWVYGSEYCGVPILRLCQLGYQAGMLGAALYGMTDEKAH